MNQIIVTDSSFGCSKISMRVRRLNRIAAAIKAKEYLEIGVCRGETFLNIDVANKVAVDPKFQFDLKSNQKAGLRFCEVVSDAFFSSLTLSEKFDLIYLDGLHVFEQTYRDFCNSLQHAHDGTVILVDDTMPNDIFSAIPNQALCGQLRRKSGVQGSAWHGDVFKLVFALHDFHPGFNYRTIVGSGNPQTLIWSSKSGWRTPTFKSMEEISRMSYVDLLRQKAIMRECGEDEAISLCIKELSAGVK